MSGLNKILIIGIVALLSGCSGSPEVPASDNPTTETEATENTTQNKEISTNPEKNSDELGQELLTALKDYYITGTKVQSSNTQKDKGEYVALSSQIDSLLEGGANVEYRDAVGNTPLSVATKNKDTGIMDRLLKKGANPNGTTPEGYGLLNSSLEDDNLEGSLLLLDNGANPDGIDPSYTPLSICANRSLNNGSFTNMGKTLLSKNANPNVFMNNKEPILLFTIKTRNSDFSNALVDAGSDIHYIDENNITILNWAILLNENETAKKMIEKDGEVLNSKRGISPLGWASLVKNQEMYDYINNIKLEVKENEKGWAALRLEETLSPQEIEKLLGGNVPLPVANIAPKKSGKRSLPLKKMKFLSIDYGNDYVKIYTDDEMKGEMKLNNPTRLVFDFNRLSGVQNIEDFPQDDHIQKILVGRHEGWYRVVFYMKKKTKYTTVREADGIRVLYKK